MAGRSSSLLTSWGSFPLTATKSLSASTLKAVAAAPMAAKRRLCSETAGVLPRFTTVESSWIASSSLADAFWNGRQTKVNISSSQKLRGQDASCMLTLLVMPLLLQHLRQSQQFDEPIWGVLFLMGAHLRSEVVISLLPSNLNGPQLGVGQAVHSELVNHPISIGGSGQQVFGHFIVGLHLPKNPLFVLLCLFKQKSYLVCLATSFHSRLGFGHVAPVGLGQISVHRTHPVRSQRNMEHKLNGHGCRSAVFVKIEIFSFFLTVLGDFWSVRR